MPLAQITNNKMDVFLISETKTDSSFPTRQFYIQGYSLPYMLDETLSGSRILLYTRENTVKLGFCFYKPKSRNTAPMVSINTHQIMKILPYWWTWTVNQLNVLLKICNPSIVLKMSSMKTSTKTNIHSSNLHKYTKMFYKFYDYRKMTLTIMKVSYRKENINDFFNKVFLKKPQFLELSF